MRKIVPLKQNKTAICARHFLAIYLILLCFSTTLYAQRTTSTDAKGTKKTTGNIVTEAATAPTTPIPIQGDIWFDTTNNVVKTWDGSTWKTVTTDGVANEPWFGTDNDAGATSNTEDIYVTGNIGIGTSTLSAGKVATFAGDVDIQGVLDPTKIIMSGDGSVGSFNPTTNNQYEIEFQEGRDLEIKSNTTNNILHIENAGNVGIGASNPDEALHITRDADGGSVRLLIENKSANSAGSTDETAGVFFGFDGDNYAGGIQLNKASDYTSTSERDSYLSFYTDRNGTLGDPKMVIRSNGNIGIGTNTPSHTLDLRDQGDIGFHSTGADKDMIVFYDGGWKMHWIRAEYSGGGDDGNDLVFDTSSKSNALVIERSGDIGIGTSGPTRPLDVVGLARIRGLGAGDVKTDSSGNLLVSSDERLKNISGNFKRGLDAILGLTPINYTWNELSTLETENSYSGFSAQNVQANIPEAVGIDSRGYLTLSDRPITAALVNSVKELKAENDSLKAENEDLKVRLAKIEAALGIE